MESLRQTYVLRIRVVAPSESASMEDAEEGSLNGSGGRFYCSLQAIATEEIHYFASLEETVVFLRNNALAFRFKPT